MSCDTYNSGSVCMIDHVEKRVTIGHLLNCTYVLETKAIVWSRRELLTMDAQTSD